MGQVTTQLEDKTLSKLQKPELDVSANKAKGPLFDQLKDPLTDPLKLGDGVDNPLTPDQLQAQQMTIPGPDVPSETPDTQAPSGGEQNGGKDTEKEPTKVDGPGPGTEKEKQELPGDGDGDGVGESAKEDPKDGDPDKGDPNEKPGKQEPGGDGQGDPSGKGKPGPDTPGKQDNVSPGSTVGGVVGAEIGSDGVDETGSGETAGSGGVGPDGSLLDFASLSAGELDGYINEKAWHDYWVNRSDTGMATSDKWGLIGRAAGAGALEGLVNGVSAGLIQGVMATATKKLRFAGGVFTAVDIFKMGPVNWASQSFGKFTGAADKWQTGDTIDKVEAVLDVLDGINTVIGQLSGICLMVAGLGSVVAVASIFFPFLLPIVPFLLTVIPLAAQWGMMLGKINAIAGAALTFLKLIPIGLRMRQILLSDADPALQAARAEKLSKQVSSFTEDASSRVVKSGTEKGTGKVMEKGGQLLSGKSIATPKPEAQTNGKQKDGEVSRLRQLFNVAFDTDHLSAKANRKDFASMSKQTRANTADVNQIKQQNTALQTKNNKASESSGKANGLENLHDNLSQKLMSNKVSKKDMKLWGQVGSDANQARSQANVDQGRQDKTHGKYKSAVLGKLAFNEGHGTEAFTGDQAKAWRDRGFNSMATGGMDAPIEGLKGLPDNGSVGGTDLPDDKLNDPTNKLYNKELYDLKMGRAGDAQKARSTWTDGARKGVRGQNDDALDARVQEFPEGSAEFTSGQSAYSDRIMDIGVATSNATVDATMTPQQRTGMSADQKSARDALRPKIQAAMDAMDATRDRLQQLPPPPAEQESILTNAADNAAKIQSEIDGLNAMKADLAAQKRAAQVQAQVADKAVQIGKTNVDNANKERQVLEEKEAKRKKAREDMEKQQKQAGSSIDPIGGFLSGVTDMVGWLMRLAGVLPDSVGGDQVKAANPRALQTGLTQMQTTGTDAKAQLGTGIRVADEQSRVGTMAANWMNGGYTGLLSINARLAKDRADSLGASQQFNQAESTLIERLAKLEAGREAQRQRHAAALGTIQGWTQAHRAERLQKQGELDANMSAVDNLLQSSGQPTSAQVG